MCSTCKVYYGVVCEHSPPPRPSRLVVKSIRPPPVEHWWPLVVLANTRSGGKDGETVLSSFRKLLNPVQVCPSIFVCTLYMYMQVLYIIHVYALEKHALQPLKFIFYVSN